MNRCAEPAPAKADVEPMNRTIKKATFKRYHYDSYQQLEAHLHDFIDAYDYGRRLKTLKSLTPFGYICKIWTTQPNILTLNPTHQMPGLNIAVGKGNQSGARKTEIVQ